MKYAARQLDDGEKVGAECRRLQGASSGLGLFQHPFGKARERGAFDTRRHGAVKRSALVVYEATGDEKRVLEPTR
jgi:hypothetical protein